MPLPITVMSQSLCPLKLTLSQNVLVVPESRSDLRLRDSVTDPGAGTRVNDARLLPRRVAAAPVCGFITMSTCVAPGSMEVVPGTVSVGSRPDI